MELYREPAYDNVIAAQWALFRARWEQHTGTNLALDVNLEDTVAMLAGFIPNDPIDLPEESLIPLMEHHVPPFRSEEYFFSEEREKWMQRFQSEASGR